MIDHSNRTTRKGDQYAAAGSFGKPAAVDVAYFFEKEERFNEAVEGTVRVDVVDDRRGKLDFSQHFRVGGQGEGNSLTWRKAQPNEVGTSGEIMDAVAAFLRDAGEPVTKSQLKKAVKGTDAAKIDAADKLATMVGSGVHWIEFQREDSQGRQRRLRGYDYLPERDEGYKSAGMSF